MSSNGVEARIRQIQEAAQDEHPLVTAPSPASVRTNAGAGLAMLPYLTINDIIQLRAHGFEELEDIEERILEVPEITWPRVVELIRADVAQVDPTSLIRPEPEVDEQHNPRCLAFTKGGNRCRNRSRDGSKYCSSHKGYRPSQAELEARKEGLVASP